jgi:hypothetical protein
MSESETGSPLSYKSGSGSALKIKRICNTNFTSPRLCRFKQVLDSRTFSYCEVWIAFVFSIKKLEIFELLKRQISRELHKDPVLKPRDAREIVTSGHVAPGETVTSGHVGSVDAVTSGQVVSKEGVTSGNVATSSRVESAEVMVSASVTSNDREAVTSSHASATSNLLGQNVLGPFRE